MSVSEKNPVANQNDGRAPRAKKPARSWGDINLTLNRLVREGVISGFKTNLSSPDRTSGIQVAITAPNQDPEQEAEIRRRVSGDLEALIDDVEITVNLQQAA